MPANEASVLAQLSATPTSNDDDLEPLTSNGDDLESTTSNDGALVPPTGPEPTPTTSAETRSTPTQAPLTTAGQQYVVKPPSSTHPQKRRQ